MSGGVEASPQSDADSVVDYNEKCRSGCVCADTDLLSVISPKHSAGMSSWLASYVALHES